MKRIYATIGLAALFCAAAYGQNGNLNPVVRVTNKYQGSVAQAEKSSLDVCVPDSLYKFDLNFDYSGFEKPYGGNDEFNLYRTDLELARRPYDGKKFYMKAGAGYSCAPVLDLSYTFKPQGKFKAGLHATHDSYFGRYNTIGGAAGELTRKGDWWVGFDASTVAGMDARADLGRLSMVMNLDYEGIHAKGVKFGGDPTKNYYNGLKASLGFISNLPYDKSPVSYKVNMEYAFGYNGVLEHNAKVDALVDYEFRKNMALSFGAKVDVTLGRSAKGIKPYYVDRGPYTGFTAIFSPEYHYRKERVSLGAGLAFKYSDVLVDPAFRARQQYPFFAYPTLDLKWVAVPGYLDVYAGAKLESEMFSERAKSKEFRFFVMDETAAISTTYKVDLGLRGNIVEQLHYNISGGYEWLDGKGEILVVPTLLGELFPMVEYSSIHDAFVAADLRAEFYGVTIAADVKYRHFINGASLAVKPSALKVGGAVRYDWRNRLAVYSSVHYQSEAYAGVDCKVPGFVNLSAGVRYFITRSVGVFLQGENLLNQNCQYIPLYSRRGICATAGLALNF